MRPPAATARSRIRSTSSTRPNGAGSQEGDISSPIRRARSTRNIILQDNQRLLGEGNNLTFTVNTLQEGTITIPESSPGARRLRGR